MSKVAAIITAGGIGARTGLEIPKQFVVVEDKPIIIHTLENFENHKYIDIICVPCLAGWEEKLESYAKEFHITKLKIITQGGQTGFESIRNALFALKPYLDDKDIVMVHDSIRPLVSERLISDNLALCRAKGNAVAVIDSVEALLQTASPSAESAEVSLDRSLIKRTQTPQSIMFGTFMTLHKLAKERGILDSTTPSTLLTTLGHAVWTCRGDEGNIKITHAQDIEIFRAILALRNNAYSHYQNLCAQGNKRLVQHGLVILSQGNFSLRIPGTDLICIKPSGVDYATLCPEMIPIVRLDGAVLAGRLKPSVDTPTHLEVYRHNPKITNITHTHSTFATAFAQAALPIPVLGTTHADFCAHDIELVATPDVADMGDYEHATGVAINALLATRESLPPAVLIPYHAPFAFGFKTLDSTENALILEEVAKNSYLSLALNGQAKAPEYLIRKAYNRKHGADAYYGQE